MLDEGVGPAVYDTVLRDYEVPENVRLFDVGCMSLDMLPYVESYDVIITVDAVDGTGDAPGTVYRFSPDAMARHSGAMASLHDLKLVNHSERSVDFLGIRGRRLLPGDAGCQHVPFRVCDGFDRACALGAPPFWWKRSSPSCIAVAFA